jgi:cytochrome P450
VLEAKLVLATLLQHVDLDLSGAALRPVPRVTLTAGGGVAVTVRRRRGVTPLAA